MRAVNGVVAALGEYRSRGSTSIRPFLALPVPYLPLCLLTRKTTSQESLFVGGHWVGGLDFFLEWLVVGLLVRYFHVGKHWEN